MKVQYNAGLRHHTMKIACALAAALFLCALASISACAAQEALPLNGAPALKENPDAEVRLQGGRAVLVNPKSGAVYTGYKKRREIPAASGSLYYFRKRDGRVYNSGFFKAGKKTYYAQQNGQLLAGGVYRVGGYAYYFSPKGILSSGGIIKAQRDVRYYADAKGRLKKGLKKIKGNYYYFERNTYQMQFGWVKRGDKVYYMRTSGKRMGQAVTGLLKKDGSQYYFDSKGRMVHGWVVIGGKKNYFDLETGERYTGVHYIDGKRYNFGKNGIDVTGPWKIQVNQSTCTVTIFRGDTAIKAFACSVGAGGATPTGTFKLLDKLRWHELMGPSWGQWCSHITSDILFHSIPYNRYQDNRSMNPNNYNLLGQAVSHGCIRLAAGDAKYIYDNCPIGTPVVIFYGSSKKDPLGKPMPKYVGSWDRNYDPTDPTI